MRAWAIAIGLVVAQAAHADDYRAHAIEPRARAENFRALLGNSPAPRGFAKAVARDGFWAGAPLGADACAGCHPDVAAAWAQSAHRFSSFNNPYYRISVDDFRRERGGPASRFCAACHEPLLMDTVAQSIDRASPAAQAGLTCLVCHSVDGVTDLDGNGHYALQPRPWSTERGEHGARLRPAILSDAKFCGSCHKVGLDADVTRDRWLRGQDDYDAWHASAASGHGAGATFRPTASARCQDCHMPLEPALLGDAAAKNGLIRSHRFLAANAALPNLRGDSDGVARVGAFLDGAVAIDLSWSGDDRVDVLVRNRRVGHKFPGGTNDSNEVWLEVEARDAAGGLLGRSGALSARGDLDGEAHRVRAQPVDGDGRPLERRDPQHMRGVAFDASLAPAEPQVIRYLIPPHARTVRARLLYRKFSAEYARRACAGVRDPATKERCLNPPVIELGRARLEAGAVEPDDWRRLTEHGLALAAALVDTASEGEPLFLRAAGLAPERPEPLIGLARLQARLGRTDEALATCARASQLDRAHPAPDFIAASALLDAYRVLAARAPVERLLARLPDDRAALALAARARGLAGDARGALDAAEKLLALDPGLDEGHYHRALALADLGRGDEAERAEADYLKYRVATEIDLALRKKWRDARPPDSPDESVPVHTHALRPPTQEHP